MIKPIQTSPLLFRPDRNAVFASGAHAVLAWALMTGVAAQAQSLPEALQQAYLRSEQVASAQAEHDADQAGIVISRADGLPTVGTSVDLTERIAGSDNRSGRVNVQGQMSVPLFQGGTVRNSVLAARSRSDASSIAVASAETDVFTLVVSTYANVIRDQRIVELSRTNLQSLTTTLEATRARYRARDLTRTDVAQSDARAALARGELESAAARLNESMEEFRRLTGAMPSALAPLPPMDNMPATAEMAAAVALEENPLLISAKSVAESRRFEVRAARGEALPRVSAVVNGRYSDSETLATTPTDSRFGATVGVSMSMSIFQGGRVPARVRQASVRENQAELEVQRLQRTLAARARSEFANWQAARAVVVASEQAVEASRQALSGVRAESDVGSRTILDILNAEQELRNAQVQLVTAQRDAYVAAFSLLATMGRAQARNLGIERQNIVYDIGGQSDGGDGVMTQPGVDVGTGDLSAYHDNNGVPPISQAPPPPSEPPPPPPPQPPAETAMAQSVGRFTDPQVPMRNDAASSTRQMWPIPPTHWVIQLAAHDSAAAARNHWNQVRTTVSRTIPASTPLVASASNSARPVYRLAVGSFADFAEAETLCHDLRMQEQTCIVRRFSTLGRVEWSDRANSVEMVR